MWLLFNAMASLGRTLQGSTPDGPDGCYRPRLPELRGEDEATQGGAQPLGVQHDQVIAHLRLEVHDLTHQLQLLDHLEVGHGGAAQGDDDCSNVDDDYVLTQSDDDCILTQSDDDCILTQSDDVCILTQSDDDCVLTQSDDVS